MRQIETDIAVVGAGSAGLCAAIQASKAGAKVMVFDENAAPGGQLFKQIHKFFGSSAHRAGIRGYVIGQQLLDEVKASGAEVRLNSVVYGIFDGDTLGIIENEKEHYAVKAKKIILAGGAKENYMGFPGSTLPGVMGAGAAQTMINVNRVLPGRKILMIGSGNVGLIVSYQLMQAGADVLALVEAAPKIGGYGVHAGKIRRAGVPIMLGHTVLEAYGEKEVEGAIVAEVDNKFEPIPGTEKDIKCDTICLAVGLNPMTELAYMAGCEMAFVRAFGGHVPMHDEYQKTTVDTVYVAGDITSPEEASTAMEEGNIAGLAAAMELGTIDKAEAQKKLTEFVDRINSLRSGEFGEGRRLAKLEQIEAFHKFMDSQEAE